MTHSFPTRRSSDLGLALPFDDVFAWNSRGDVWAMAPDGCTTVLLPAAQPEQPRPVLAHNEDGHAGLRRGCALAQVSPEDGKAFTAFVYPASLPGHTFAVTETGPRTEEHTSELQSLMRHSYADLCLK